MHVSWCRNLFRFACSCVGSMVRQSAHCRAIMWRRSLEQTTLWRCILWCGGAKVQSHQFPAIFGARWAPPTAYRMNGQGYCGWIRSPWPWAWLGLTTHAAPAPAPSDKPRTKDTGSHQSEHLRPDTSAQFSLSLFSISQYLYLPALTVTFVPYIN